MSLQRIASPVLGDAQRNESHGSNSCRDHREEGLLWCRPCPQLIDCSHRQRHSNDAQRGCNNHGGPSLRPVSPLGITSFNPKAPYEADRTPDISQDIQSQSENTQAPCEQARRDRHSSCQYTPADRDVREQEGPLQPVSYTHLTLP